MLFVAVLLAAIGVVRHTGVIVSDLDYGIAAFMAIAAIVFLFNSREHYSAQLA